MAPNQKGAAIRKQRIARAVVTKIVAAAAQIGRVHQRRAGGIDFGHKGSRSFVLRCLTCLSIAVLLFLGRETHILDGPAFGGSVQNLPKL
jgi:hypothetical protein